MPPLLMSNTLIPRTIQSVRPILLLCWTSDLTWIWRWTLPGSDRPLQSVETKGYHASVRTFLQRMGRQNTRNHYIQTPRSPTNHNLPLHMESLSSRRRWHPWGDRRYEYWNAVVGRWPPPGQILGFTVDSFKGRVRSRDGEWRGRNEGSGWEIVSGVGQERDDLLGRLLERVLIDVIYGRRDCRNC